MSLRPPDAETLRLTAELAAARAQIAALTRLAESPEDLTEPKLALERLKESEQLYRGLFDSSRDAVLILEGPTWGFTSGNLAALAMFGVSTRAELTRLKPADLSPERQPDGRLSADKALEVGRLAMTEGSHLFEWMHRRADGSQFPAAVLLSRTVVGDRVFLQATARDITHAKQLEQALHDSKQLVEAIVENIPLTVFVKEAKELRFVVFNRAGEQLLGRDRAELIGKSDLDLFPPEQAARFIENDRLVLSEGIALDLPEEPVTTAKKGDRLLHTRKVCIQGADGVTKYLLGLSEDITERKQAETALRESEYFFRESQRAASIGSYKFHFRSGRWESSEVLDRIFGIGADDLRTVEGWIRLVHPDEQAEMGRYLVDMAAGVGTLFDREYRIIRRSDGETRWVHGRGDIVRDPDGTAALMIGTIQDISDRKRGEDEKAKLEAQLQQAQKMESIGRLAGGVAHDFNNMLGVILGHTELALEQVEPGRSLFRDLLEIRDAATRSADLTRQLLAFARKQTVAPKVLDLNEAVANMLTLLRRLIGEAVEMVWLPGATLWPVRMDPSQIDQLVTNLCVNGRNAIFDVGDVGDAGGVGRLTIETRNSTLDETYCAGHPGAVVGDYVSLTVRDDGCGMDAATQSHLFEPFFTTREMGKGTGLGLAMVYGIVKQNLGFITVESAPGQGATFTIHLPRHLGAAASGPKPTAESAPRGHETILLVEDEPAILRVTKRMLERIGYRVIGAGTPGEALRLAAAHADEVRLLMTDVIMPEMNGRELSQRLVSLSPRLVTLFMSGYTADVIAGHGVLEAGLNFLQKPFSRHELAAAVRRALDAPVNA